MTQPRKFPFESRCVACAFSGLAPCMQCQGLACALDETKHVRGMQCHGAWHVLFLDLYPACSARAWHVHWMKPNMYVACSAMVRGMFFFWTCTLHAVQCGVPVTVWVASDRVGCQCPCGVLVQKVTVWDTFMHV